MNYKIKNIIKRSIISIIIVTIMLMLNYFFSISILTSFLILTAVFSTSLISLETYNNDDKKGYINLSIKMLVVLFFTFSILIIVSKISMIKALICILAYNVIILIVTIFKLTQIIKNDIKELKKEIQKIKCKE